MADPALLRRFLRPRTIALVGLAPPDDEGQPQTHWDIMGMRVLANLRRFGFDPAALHFVSRAATIDGHPAYATIADLPDGIDIALLALEAAAIPQAIAQCGARGIRAAIVYASGFAEDGDAGRQRQRDLVEAAARAGVAVLGPNTVGLSNFADGLSLSFGNHKPVPLDGRRAVGLITQTGGVSGQTRLALEALGVPVSYSVCTGNEAVLCAADFLDFMVADAATAVILVFAEEIRQPDRFFAAARRARDAGKPIVLLHPGRSARARQAAASNSGAEPGDHAATIAAARAAGCIVTETLETFWDTAELLLRFGGLPGAGAALLTDGGVKGIIADICEREGLPLAALSPAVADRLCEAAGRAIPEGNPIDLSSAGLTDWHVYGRAARVLLDDPAVGSLLIAIMPGPPDIGLRNARATLPALTGATKPVTYVLMGGDSPLAPELAAAMRAAGIPFRRSPERAIRTLAHLTRQSLENKDTAG
ncbi:MAG TPA: CoA-binding protein [Sphingomonadaceae bacterium]|nr:CoA-binding protein [Sphingomonadaceae bacterium]